MTEPGLERIRRRPPRRGRVHTGRVLALAALTVVVFALGVALGAVLESNPATGGKRTSERTLAPLPPAPIPHTVTVTVTP